MKGDLRLLLRSLPYLRPSQVPQRAARFASESALLTLRGLELIHSGGNLNEGIGAEASPRHHLWRLRPEEAARVAADAAAGNFQFLNTRKEYGADIGWEDLTVPRLWRFELNGFGYAWAMAVDDPRRWGAALARLVEHWARQNPPRRCDPWHPFVVAERLINLLGTRHVWLPHLNARAEITSNLRAQVRFLRLALENDIGGNHLIREAAALAQASTAFSDASLRSQALRILRREIDRQVLPDGGHYERSPAYHLEVMLDLAEVRALLPESHPYPAELTRVLTDMANFVASLCHPDGQVAMFNDSYYWPAQPEEFLAALGLEPSRAFAFPASGYFVFGAHDDVLFFDVGPPSPRALPPHAHCDLLSIELSVQGERLIVNSGTGDYDRGTWREYWRSTRAHNTIEIDREDQSEVWGSFRMARRANPLDVQVLESDGVRAVAGGHDGYARLSNGVVHERTAIHLEGTWVLIDQLEGTGTNEIRSFLHLHPDVHVSADGGSLLLSRKAARVRVSPLGPMAASIRESRLQPVENWHATRLGQRVPARSIVAEGSTKLPVTMGWLLQKGWDQVEANLEGDSDSFTLVVRSRGDQRIIRRRGNVLTAELEQ